MWTAPARHQTPNRRTPGRDAPVRDMPFRMPAGETAAGYGRDDVQKLCAHNLALVVAQTYYAYAWSCIASYRRQPSGRPFAIPKHSNNSLFCAPRDRNEYVEGQTRSRRTPPAAVQHRHDGVSSPQMTFPSIDGFSVQFEQSGRWPRQWLSASAVASLRSARANRRPAWSASPA